MKILSFGKDLFGEYWNKSIERNPFQSPTITDLCRPTNSEILNLVFFDKKNNPLILYTIYVKEIMSLENHFSCISTYGYSSPTFFTKKSDRYLIKDFNETCNTYLLDKNIITEFERCSLDENSFSRNHIYLSHSRANVYVNLLKEKEDLFFEYNRAVRKSLKKASKQNLNINLFDKSNFTSSSIDIFCDIYLETMKRNKAESYYFFNKCKLKESIIESLLNSFGLIHIVTNPDNIPIAAEWTLLSKANAYSFLGGLNINFAISGASDFLKHHIILDLKKLGYKKYFIGGGKEDFDGIYFFKKKFSSSISVSALSTKIIHSEEKFEMALKNAYQKNFLNSDDYFPPFK